MVLVMCAVKDRAMDAFMQPFAVPAVGLAVRGFRDEVCKAGTAMNGHPDDYDLYKVGEFDDGKGQMLTCEAPTLLIRGKDCKEAV